MSSRAAKTYSARVKAKFVVVTVVFFASICLVFWFLVYLSSAFSFVSRMSPIRRKGRFVSRDVDKRKTFFRDNFAGVGRKTAVIKKGVRMIAAKSPPPRRPLVAICPLPCRLAQAILTRKVTNRYSLTRRTMERTVSVLEDLFFSLSFVLENVLLVLLVNRRAAERDFR